MICIAKIGRPLGVKGEVNLIYYGEDVRSLLDLDYREFLVSKDVNLDIFPSSSTLEDRVLEGDRVLEVSGEHRVLSLVYCVKRNKKLVAKFEHINSIEQAEVVKNDFLFLRRDQLPEVETDQWYIRDLIGLNCYGHGTGELFGKIIRIERVHKDDVLVICDCSNSEHFVLFTKESVPVVDLGLNRVELILPKYV